MRKKLQVISETESPKLGLRKRLLIDRKTQQAALKYTRFISSGCYLLNLALTGKIHRGFPIGRFVLVKGAFSAGKTVLAIEAINVGYYIEKLLKKKKVAFRYNDAEAALDAEFSDDLNLPEEVETVDPPTETVEEFHQDLTDFIERHKDCDLAIYVLDSMDALLVREEQEEIKKKLAKIKKSRLKLLKKDEEKKEEKKTGEEKEKEEKESGSYGAQKAKYMSKFYRDLRNKLKKTNCLLIIVCQLRDDLAKKYGDKSTISGGKASGYYGSQIIDLRRIEDLKKLKSSELKYGTKVRAKVVKNKVWRDGREAEFDIVTNPAHGIDNYGTMIDFMTKRGEIPYSMGKYTWNEEKYTREQLIKYFFKNKSDWEELLNAAQAVWDQIEENCCVERGNKWENVVIEKE